MVPNLARPRQYFQRLLSSSRSVRFVPSDTAMKAFLASEKQRKELADAANAQIEAAAQEEAAQQKQSGENNEARQQAKPSISSDGSSGGEGTTGAHRCGTRWRHRRGRRSRRRR